MRMGDYITCEQCEAYRKEIYDVNQDQNLTLAELKTRTGLIEKIMFAILGTLITGFAGTIFAVLSVG